MKLFFCLIGLIVFGSTTLLSDSMLSIFVSPLLTGIFIVLSARQLYLVLKSSDFSLLNIYIGGDSGIDC